MNKVNKVEALFGLAIGIVFAIAVIMSIFG